MKPPVKHLNKINNKNEIQSEMFNLDDDGTSNRINSKIKEFDKNEKNIVKTRTKRRIIEIITNSLITNWSNMIRKEEWNENEKIK